MAYAHLHNALDEVQPLNIVNLSLEQRFFWPNFNLKKIDFELSTKYFSWKKWPKFCHKSKVFVIGDWGMTNVFVTRGYVQKQSFFNEILLEDAM
jgi:hypothetical protein